VVEDEDEGMFRLVGIVDWQGGDSGGDREDRSREDDSPGLMRGDVLLKGVERGTKSCI
jgi:hypothetical protein